MVAMTRFMLLIHFVISLTGVSAGQCPINNCEINSCNNNTCTKCDASYFLTDNNYCSECYLNCSKCYGEECYTCLYEKCDSCINNCSCVSSIVPCSTCPEGYYKFESKCYKCHYHKCTCSGGYGCTGCLAGYYGSSNRCVNSCPKDCLTCKSSAHCTKCVSGKYGQVCQKNCTAICNDNTCNKVSGTCIPICATGHYLDKNNTCIKCPLGCSTCEDDNACLSCNKSYWGNACQYECKDSCDDGTCDRISGLCPGKCSIGQYSDINKTCKNCPERCFSCTDFQTCSSCKMGYWGNACQFNCTGCHESCDKNHGCSAECENYYFKSDDATKSGYICTRCPDNCFTCSSLDLCNKCTTGYWGTVCQYACSGCSGSCVQHTGCKAGCSVGYYQRVVSGGFLCEKCSGNCLVCRNNTACEACDDGYYLSTKLNCVPCVDNCKDGNCNKNDGSCLAGCKDSWFGLYCNESCPSNCKQCDQICNSCKVGFYGDMCEYNCSLQCEEEGGRQTCNKSSGFCLQGCKTGYWGKSCDLSCEFGCESETCNEITGLCLNGCKNNFFGIQCDRECAKACLHDLNTSRQCDETSGNCENGCQDGWFGQNCSSDCNAACKETVCFQLNGTCVYGHADASTTVSGDYRGYSEPFEAGNNLALPVGAGTGAAVVITLVIVILVLFIRHRRATRKREQSKNTTDAVGDSNVQHQGDVTYATVNKQPSETIHVEEAGNTPPRNDVTYATVNKRKPASLETMSETIILNAKSSVVMSNATRDVDAEDVIIDIKPKHTAKIESLTADTLSDIKNNRKPNKLSKKNQEKEKESSPVMVDPWKAGKDALPKKESEKSLAQNDIVENYSTYYNTVKKRVPLSGLAEYIKNKDHNILGTEFQKLPNGLQKEHIVAKKPKNAAKNRYKQIYPYDESRVVLSDGENDYVNASFIKGCNRPKEYIASSGPFQRGKIDNQTVSDLWRMVWQEQCETIVMLTKCYENEEQKCVQYWPELGSSKQHGSLNVTCVTEDQYADFIIRSFIVNKDGQNLSTRHLQFTAWPDKGVPTDVTSMIEFRQKVRSLHKDAVCPMLVHCSAGIGRTGTFIALDIQTNIGKSSGYVDVFACVSELRNQRVNLVQTPEQYVYLHHAVLHALTFDSQSIPAEKFIETYSRMIKKNEGQSHIQRQFLKLQSTIDEISVEDKKAMDQNRAFTDKNRNGADIPGDENRVILHGNRKPGSPNYINAVYINGFRSRNNFIAAQIPLPTTLVDFLSLIVQEKCSKVVMMEEVDTQNKTVGVFWPADNQVLKHGVFQVRCKGSKTSQTYKLKELSIESRTGKTADKLDVDLYIYTDWPKEAVVPQSSDSLLQLIKAVGTHNCQQENDAPVLILCMTGAERSCLFCAVSVLIEKMEIEHEVSVVNTLRQIKARRRSAIPTLEQYKFCHQAVISYLQTFDIYSNFGLKEKEAN